MKHPIPTASSQKPPLRRGGKLRRGGAAVELAILSPILLLIFVIVVDFGRVFYYSQIVENAARAGAVYASDPDASSPYLNVDSAVDAEARNLSPKPTVTTSNGTDAAGNSYVRVRVNWTFQVLSTFPGVPATVALSRTVQMRSLPP